MYSKYSDNIDETNEDNVGQIIEQKNKTNDNELGSTVTNNKNELYAAQQDQNNKSGISKSTAPGFASLIFGQTGCLVLIVFFITALVALRYFKIIPLLSDRIMNSRSNANLQQNSNYTFIASQNFSVQATELAGIGSPKLFYYDQFNEAVYEVNTNSITLSARAVSRGTSGVISSVDKVVISPDGQMACVISSRIKDKTGLFILNFSRAEADDFIQRWSLGLPGNFLIDDKSTVSWSPDSTTVAFTASKETQSDLFVVKSEKDVKRITYLGKNIGAIAWLDGQRLAFVSDWEGKDQIYTIKSDGGDLRPLQR